VPITVAVLKARILDILGDVDPENRAVHPFRFDTIINRQVHRLASRTMRPQETVQSITLVVGTYDYALASSGLVDHVSQVFLDADGSELLYVPFDLFNSRYRQATSEPAASGPPCEYTLWETAANVMTLRVGPTPDNAADGPIKVYYSILPAMLSNSVYSVLTGIEVIPFGNELIVGLEAACCADAVAGMNEESVKRLGIDKGIAIQQWAAEVESAIRAHNLRQLKNGKLQDHVFRTSGHRLAGWFARS